MKVEVCDAVVFVCVVDRPATIIPRTSPKDKRVDGEKKLLLCFAKEKKKRKVSNCVGDRMQRWEPKIFFDFYYIVIKYGYDTLEERGCS